MLLMSRIKVPNKSLSYELNNVVNGMDVTILTSLNETNFHCYLSMEYLRNGDINTFNTITLFIPETIQSCSVQFQRTEHRCSEVQDF